MKQLIITFSLLAIVSCSKSKPDSEQSLKTVQNHKSTATKDVTTNSTLPIAKPFDKQVFSKTNFKGRTLQSDTITLNCCDRENLIELRLEDFNEIFNQKGRLDYVNDYFPSTYYFDQLIQDDDSSKTFTLYSSHDGGPSQLNLIHLSLKDSCYSYTLAQSGEEEETYTILEGNQFSIFDAYNPMATESSYDDSTFVNYYWTEKHTTVDVRLWNNDFLFTKTLDSSFSLYTNLTLVYTPNNKYQTNKTLDSINLSIYNTEIYNDSTRIDSLALNAKSTFLNSLEE